MKIFRLVMSIICTVSGIGLVFLGKPEMGLLLLIYARIEMLDDDIDSIAAKING